MCVPEGKLTISESQFAGFLSHDGDFFFLSKVGDF